MELSWPLSMDYGYLKQILSNHGFCCSIVLGTAGACTDQHSIYSLRLAPTATLFPIRAQIEAVATVAEKLVYDIFTTAAFIDFMVGVF